jgi:integrase/recombinase XerD
VQSLCSILKVLFRYLYRVGLMTRDLSKAIESPRRYSFANLPRSISWSEVEQMLQKVDRRNAVGKRDYAVLLLLVTYGLRAREVGALTLDDIDWKRDRLHIRGRKAGHSTAYPLALPVGGALLDYLKHGRPEKNERLSSLELTHLTSHCRVAGLAISSSFGLSRNATKNNGCGMSAGVTDRVWEVSDFGGQLRPT